MKGYLKHALVLGLLMTLAPAVAAEAPQPLRVDGRVFAPSATIVPLARAINLCPLSQGVGTVLQQPIPLPRHMVSDRVRLHIKALNAGSGTWRIQVRDRSGEVRATITGAQMRGGSWWSDALPYEFDPIVEVIASEPRETAQLAVDALMVFFVPADFKAITIPDGRVSILNETRARIRDWGKLVVRLEIPDHQGHMFPCTAFLITSNVVMTNFHCVSRAEDLDGATADFDYDGADVSYSTLRLIGITGTPNQALDYTLCVLEHNVDRQPLTLDGGGQREYRELAVIQHPRGLYKQVSTTDCTVDALRVPGTTTDLTDFSHGCDTENGSSGSPIQDRATGIVVGLHHLGFVDDAGGVAVNRGVWMYSIVADMSRTAPDVYSRVRIAPPVNATR